MAKNFKSKNYIKNKNYRNKSNYISANLFGVRVNLDIDEISRNINEGKKQIEERKEKE